jgi:hypothetical protein
VSAPSNSIGSNVDSFAPAHLIRRFPTRSSFGAAIRQSISTFPKVSVRHFVAAFGSLPHGYPRRLGPLGLCAIAQVFSVFAFRFFFLPPPSAILLSPSCRPSQKAAALYSIVVICNCFSVFFNDLECLLLAPEPCFLEFLFKRIYESFISQRGSQFFVT